MTVYEFYCGICDGLMEADYPMSSGPPSHIDCPVCGAPMPQNFRGKRIEGKVPHGWSEGKIVHQLHPRDPDKYVTNRNDMNRVYEKSGICKDSGQIIDQKKFDAKQSQVLKSHPGQGSQGKLRRRSRNPR